MVWVYVILVVIHKTLAFLSPLMLEKLINAIIKADSFYVLLHLTMWNLSVDILFVLANYARNYFRNRAENKINFMEHNRIMQGLLSVPLLGVRKKTVGQYIHMVERDADRVTGLAFADFTVLITNILLSLAIFVYMICTDWVLALLVFASFPIFLIVTKRMIPRIENAEKAVIAQEEQVNDVVDMLYVGNDSIKAANAQAYFANTANRFTEKLLRLKNRYAMQEELYDSLFVNGLMNLVNILVFCIGGFRVLQGAVTFGAVNTFTFYFSTLWSNVESFMGFLKQYNVKQISLNRLSAFYEEPHEDAVETSGDLPAFEQLQLQNVSLSLDNSLMLSKVNLTVNKGDKILITGENGSGKTTLARLLVKLIQPCEGCITYNGIRYQDIAATKLREHILLVPAEAFIIPGDYSENIWSETGSVSVPEAFIGKHIEKDGANLSSGQKKRIQLDRGTRSHAEVVIFDEPFNYLDHATKYLVWETICKEFEGRTILVISHDSFIAEECSRIIRIEKAAN